MDAKILQPFFYQQLQRRSMQKPILVITITDGGEQLQSRVCYRSKFLCWGLRWSDPGDMQSRRRSQKTESTQSSVMQRRCSRMTQTTVE
jgi:hypothetical protein